MAMGLSVGEFIKALGTMKVPGGAQTKFLAAHADAPGRAMTMRRLAKEANYDGWQGMNLQYGKLAKRIGEVAGVPKPRITLLVQFVPAKGVSKAHISNSEWILVMDDKFAKAIRKVGWI